MVIVTSNWICLYFRGCIFINRCHGRQGLQLWFFHNSLLQVVSIRLLLKRVRVSRLDITGEGLTFTFYQDTKVDPEGLIRMAERRPLKYRFLSGDKLKVLKRGQSPLEALGEAREVVGRFVSKMTDSGKPQ